MNRTVSVPRSFLSYISCHLLSDRSLKSALLNVVNVVQSYIFRHNFMFLHKSTQNSLFNGLGSQYCTGLMTPRVQAVYSFLLIV